MLARGSFAALIAFTLLAIPAAAQQGYAPGRPSFTLGQKLQQWGQGFFGNSPSPTPAQNGSSASHSGQRRVNHPNYHKRPEHTANSNNSSRRTAQPSYQPTANEPLEPIAEEAPVVPSPPKSVTPGKGYAPPKATSKSGGSATAQPRSLQEALFNSRAPRESSSSSTAATSRRETGKPTPAASPAAPRAAAEPSPLRTARKPDAPRDAVENEPELEQPQPAESAVPVAQKPAPASRSSEALLFTQKSPVLAVEAKGPRRTAVGHETKFKISLRNTGDVSARDVMLVVQIPAGTEIVSAHPTVGEARQPADQDSSPVLRWSVSEVPARSQEELELLLVPRKNEAIDLVVQWTFAPDTQQILVDVQEPKLQMQLAGPKEVSFGEKAIYKLTFSNPGDADAENVVVTLPAIGAGEGPADSHTIGTIRAGESKVVEMELVARQMGRLAIKAEATASAGLTASVSQEVTVRRAGVKVELEGPATGYARTGLNYKIVVSNNGNAAAANVQVAAQLPTRAKYLSSTDGGQLSGERVIWTLDSLEPGQQQVVSFKCQLENAGLNRVQAAAVVGDLRDVATLNTEVEAVADLTLSVVEPAGVFAVGEEVTYELHIKNRGTTSAEGISVVGYFSEGLEATSGSGARYEISVGRIQFGTIPTIAADQEVVLKIKARADQAGNHVFRAEAQCSALGSKLAKEGTTRFYGSESSESKDAEPEAAPTPTPATSKSGSSQGADKGERSAYRSSGSSRRRNSVSSDLYAPPSEGGIQR